MYLEVLYGLGDLAVYLGSYDDSYEAIVAVTKHCLAVS